MGTGFCGACGNPLKEGAKFCAGCGAATAVNGAATAVNGTETQGAAQQPRAGSYQYSQNNSSYKYPVKKKNSLSVIGVIVVLVLVLAVAFGAIKLFKIDIPGLDLPFLGDNSGKDVTVEELAGEWTGSMQYNDIKNLDKIPGITEDEIKTTKEIYGQDLLFSVTIDETGSAVLTVTAVDGSTSDIAELPAIELKNGEFTVIFEEGTNKFVFDGVVTEKGNVMYLNGGMTMYMDTGDGTMVTFIMSYSVSK